MGQRICEVLWIKTLHKELSFEPKEPMKIHYDNKAVIGIAQNPVQHYQTKHVEVDRRFIKEKIEGGQVTKGVVTTKWYLADIVTKDFLKLCLTLLCASWECITSKHRLKGECWKTGPAFLILVSLLSLID